MTSSIETTAEKMAEFAMGFGNIRVEVDPEDPDEVRMFLAWLSADLPEETVVLLCRGWARLIRESIPDRQDGWSSSIVVIRPLGSAMGVYFTGWLGREDAWDNDTTTETDSREWNALNRRLNKYLRVRGRTDSEGAGDYYLLDEDYGTAEQSITIHRIEFLTPELVSGIQAILREGFAAWIVHVVLDVLPAVEGISSDGLEIHADRVVEKWDRDLLTELLGDRLKL